MSETASGALRIVSLILMIAAFSAVWRGDQQTQQQFLLARKAAAKQQTLAEDEGGDAPSAGRTSRSVRNDAAEDGISEVGFIEETSYVARVEIEMPLPRQIAPGTYQVVDKTGLVQKIHIPSVPEAFLERDIYVLDQPGMPRRYFIRVTDADEASPPQTASQSDRQAE